MMIIVLNDLNDYCVKLLSQLSFQMITMSDELNNNDNYLVRFTLMISECKIVDNYFVG